MPTSRGSPRDPAIFAGIGILDSAYEARNVENGCNLGKFVLLNGSVGWGEGRYSIIN